VTSPTPDALLGPAEIRELAGALGVRPTKQRGQNFVIDANTVRRIVRTAGVRPDDVVVEVGPGLGSLTLALLEAADRVVAVEIDDVLAGALPATIAARMPDRAGRFAVPYREQGQVVAIRTGTLPVGFNGLQDTRWLGMGDPPLDSIRSTWPFTTG